MVAGLPKAGSLAQMAEMKEKRGMEMK